MVECKSNQIIQYHHRRHNHRHHRRHHRRRHNHRHHRRHRRHRHDGTAATTITKKKKYDMPLMYTERNK